MTQKLQEPPAADRTTAMERSDAEIAAETARIHYVPLQAGQMLHGGAYRVIRALGKGGMGAVYLVEDMGAFGKVRVLKEMIEYFDRTDPHAVAAAQRRFEEEGRTLARLRHAGIPDIIAYFSEEGRNYIVMEYVEGTTLLEGLTHVDAEGDLVKGQPYPVEDVLTWGSQICDVLVYLSQQDPPLIHHDIKPANIIIDRNTGVARLVDFGTAKARLVVGEGGEVGVEESSVFGTRGYAAPEMYQGESSTRSDVYSLAATLYHLLTDDDPRDHPLVFPKADQIESSLWAVLRNALHGNPGERLDAESFRQALLDVRAALLGQIKAPLIFADGSRAYVPEDLVRLCNAQWKAGKSYLYGRDFERWLRQSLFRADLADKAAEIVGTYSDRDEGLEAFLHVLDPRLPYPQLQLSPRVLRFGRVGANSRKQRTLQIRNRAGRGPLKGTISVEPADAWLSAPQRFEGEGDVEITVDASGAEQGESLSGQVTVETPYDRQTVAVQAVVAFPWLEIVSRIALGWLAGMAVGGLLAFVALNPPGAPLTYVWVGIAALLAAAVSVWRGQGSWGRRIGRAVPVLVLSAVLLAAFNWLAYRPWSQVYRADALGSWLLPVVSGGLIGLAAGIPRAFPRPEQRRVPRLAAWLLVLGSLLYCGWLLYGAVDLAAIEWPELSPALLFPRQQPLQTVAPVSPGATGGLTIGARVVVVTGGGRLSLRQSPSMDAAIIARVDPGTEAEIIDGPVVAASYTWWQVRLPNGTEGWASANWLRSQE